MITRRLLPLAALPLMALPRKAGVTAPVSALAINCGDPGRRFISCEAVQGELPPATYSRCPLCGGGHRLFEG